jgi:DNA repair protein RecN (Recombination protein N)
VQRLCQESYAELYEAEHAVLAGLDHVWKRVGELATFDPRFVPYVEARDGMKALLEDLAFTLRDFAEGIDASPGRLQEVEDRLALLERLKRKHGPTLADVVARRDALAAEHAALVGGTSSLADLERDLARASAAYLDVARNLSACARSPTGWRAQEASWPIWRWSAPASKSA